ncbi:uncharacterized protein AB675_8900 [Cyphellophora attinorum]|uniref:Protein RCR2 n=1 Tax=Cyphellophora attinorum TaxID=1664694 RepID=A0A0N1H3I1_9EURO|nr:uncharacterized protein AB675_8900 [Phialophora attinorum]KPI36153.1 hypothetical protein AB675_8900 [Phialophora attinorum]
MPAVLEPRQYGTGYCYDSFGNVGSCNSAWYDWGRWVALAVVILGFIILFFLCSCISARRRRRRGLQPMYGTGWAGRTPFGHGQAQYNPQYGRQQYPQQENNYVPGQGQTGGYYGQSYAPPAYAPENRGYFGQDNTGSTNTTQGVYEMQPPAQTYQSPEVQGGKK